MKRLKFALITLLLFYLIIFKINAQGVSINDNGSLADTSAMLDVYSTSKGILIPRMTTAERNAINLPANGLLIFNTDCQNFNVYTGSNWVPLNSGSGSVPASAGAISGSSVVCAGQSGVSYSVGAISGATSYIWNYSGAGFTVSTGSGTNSITASFSGSATSGDITVFGVSDCGNGTVSPAYSISVNPSLSAPTATAASNITSTSFSANWNSVSGATTYFLDVATDAGFTAFVTGYNSLDVGNVVTYSVSSNINCNTIYYYRVRAGNSCDTTTSSNSINLTTSACCSNQWTRKTDIGSNTRYCPAGFVIGNKLYIGTGDRSTLGYAEDLWEWDQATDTWTQKADVPGGRRAWSTGFAIGSYGYISTGRNVSGPMMNDLQEYDPIANSWTAKASLPATRCGSVTFVIGTKAYLGTGNDASWNNLKDLWEWDQGTNTWTQKADFGGVARYGAVAFSIGTKGYLGTGSDGVKRKDFWEYDPTGNSWTQKADFATARVYAAGFSIGTKGYLGTGFDTGYRNDLYEYNPTSNTWTAKASIPGSSRYCSIGLSTTTKGYITTGDTGGGYLKDLWEYCP